MSTPALARRRCFVWAALTGGVDVEDEEQRESGGAVSNRELPMMPWYPDQFAGSTRCFSFNERSAYRALLDVQWAIGPLPSDPLRLAEAIGMEPEDFARAWEVVGAKFVPVAGGIVNKRLESHRLASLERKKKASRAGRTGGKASGEARRQRPLNDRLKQSLTNAPTVVEREPNPPSPSPSPVSKTPQPPAEQGADGAKAPPEEAGSKRANGTSMRALGTNPRAVADMQEAERERLRFIEDCRRLRMELGQPDFREPYAVESLEAYRTALRMAAPRPAGAPREFG